MGNVPGSNPLLDLLRKILAFFFPPRREIPSVMQRKVLVIVFRPPAAVAAAAAKGWENPDDLIAAYIARMSAVSNNMLIYQVVGKQEVDYYPLLEDTRRYDDVTWPQALADSSKAFYRPNAQPPQLANADYARILQDFEILKQVQDQAVDEVWLFGGPYFGFYESCMVGRGAFWCNGPQIELPTRRFVVMGFNYERGVKEMVHDYGHRSESILARQFHSQAFLGLFYSPKLAPGAPLPPPASFPAPKNEFEQFLLDHGSVHRRPGGVDYSTDEFAWLSAIKPAWWPPTIDPGWV